MIGHDIVNKELGVVDVRLHGLLGMLWDCNRDCQYGSEEVSMETEREWSC